MRSNEPDLFAFIDGAPGTGDEKERLFSGRHVLMPSMAIRCEKEGVVG